jgi:hypothetical protein
MRTAQEYLTDPRLASAVDELKGVIAAQHPESTFALAAGDDPEGLYLTATVDVDDPDTVVDSFIDRLVTLQVDEGLPLYVIPIRTPERKAVIAKPDSQLKTRTILARRQARRAAVAHRMESPRT